MDNLQSIFNQSTVDTIDARMVTITNHKELSTGKL